MNIHSHYAIIVAAGTGSRFGSDTPKQYLEIQGKTVLRHTIDKFLKIFEPSQIRVIINSKHQDLYEETSKGLFLPPPIHGGATRQQSVYNGIKSIKNVNKNAKLLIHDAARPLINPNDIQALINELNTSKAATLCSKETDTITNTVTNEFLERENLRALQTPQGFHFDVILKVHELFKGVQNAIDDTSLVKKAGYEINFVESQHPNFKITTNKDLQMANTLMQQKSLTRIGLGFDVHAFDENPQKNVKLGGIDIPHTRALKGHSDADVALHAITDALLGAIAAGDIGDAFPPSDPKFKDMDSAIFLKEALNRVDEFGGKIINIDLTIICEEPKIGPHKDKIQQRIAEILDICKTQIGVKATTSEKLGFTGRKEGIAAQAIASIEVQE